MQKMNKMEMRKKVEMENQYLLQMNNQRSRSQTQGNDNSFDIGYKAEI